MSGANSESRDAIHTYPRQIRTRSVSRTEMESGFLGTVTALSNRDDTMSVNSALPANNSRQSSNTNNYYNSRPRRSVCDDLGSGNGRGGGRGRGRGKGNNGNGNRGSKKGGSSPNIPTHILNSTGKNGIHPFFCWLFYVLIVAFLIYCFYTIADFPGIIHYAAAWITDLISGTCYGAGTGTRTGSCGFAPEPLSKSPSGSQSQPSSGPFVGSNGSRYFSEQEVQSFVNQAIAKYDADKTGLPDLALESAGGQIVSTRDTKISKISGSTITFFGIPIWNPSNSARCCIQREIIPGKCWGFEGEGSLVIKLVSPAKIAGFSVEHLPKGNSPKSNIRSAPKHFEVFGLTDYNNVSTAHSFGEFDYEDTGIPLQSFQPKNVSSEPFPFVEFKIKTNHGSDYTCLYRVRVHGSLVGN